MSNQLIRLYHLAAFLMVFTLLSGQTTSANHPIFTFYPWVQTLVNESDCSTESIALFESGVHQFLLITDASDTQILYYQDGTRYCQNSSNYDCVSAYGLSEPIDVWHCEDQIIETSCRVTLTNTTCRTIHVYDQSDNFLTTLRPGPFGNQPPPFIPSIWEDPNPLTDSEERVYIFKERNFVITQKTASCLNPDIDTRNIYSVACNDGLSAGTFTNIGCRILTIHDTGSNTIATLSSGESFNLIITNHIFILLAGTDTIGVQSDFAGEINSGGCGNGNNEDPINYADYDIIFKICSGDTLSLPNPYRDVQCPLSPECLNTPVICENFPFRQFPDWTNNTQDEIGVNFTNFNDARLLVSPSTTTTYTGAFPPFRCGFGPTGPNGPSYKYLVIVEDEISCSTNTEESTKFTFEACIGEIISVPIPNHGSYCGDGPLQNNDGVVEIVERNSDELVLKILSSGTITYGQGTSDVLVRTGVNVPTVYVSCPLTTYEYAITLKTNCPIIENTQIFEDYPWLDNLINATTCSTESIAIYQQGIHQFLLITDANANQVLYYQDGTRYCQNSSTYDCVNAYGLDGPISSWQCKEQVTSDPNCQNHLGTIFFRDCDNGQQFYFIETMEGIIYDPYLDLTPDFEPIDGQKVNFDFVDANFNSPCSIAQKAINITCIEKADNPVTGGDCSANKGTIVYENCDDGTEFVFIKSTQGEIFDLYFAEGIDFLKYPNQQVQFDYAIADFESPCSIADLAIIVTCIEETSFSDDNDLGTLLFEKYPFLSTLVSPNDCQSVIIEEYDLGNYAFLFVQTDSNEGTLYFENGDFYCQEAPNYDCRKAYNLENPTNTWLCPNFTGFIERNNTLLEVTQQSLKIYPNPTLGSLIVELPHSKKDIELTVFDVFGRMIQRNIIIPNKSNSKRIDLSNQQNGIYYVQVSTNGLRYVKKIVKQDLN